MTEEVISLKKQHHFELKCKAIEINNLKYKKPKNHKHYIINSKGSLS